MNPTIAGAVAAEQQRDLRVRAAAERRARLVEQSVVPHPVRKAARAGRTRARAGAVRAWLALGQL
jgi:hypothetical protein